MIRGRDRDRGQKGGSVISGGAPPPTAALDFSVAANSQYLTIIF